MATILVIDDDSECSDLLRRALHKHGHEAVLAANGWEGLIALDKQAIDLVILDLMMPGMDGGTFLRILRNDKRRTGLPVIVLSAVTSGELYTRTLRLGVQDVLVKANYTLHQLLETIDRRLANAHGVEPGPTYDPPSLPN